MVQSMLLSLVYKVNLFFFFCSVLKRDRSENLPGWMGHVLCQMVTSSGCYFLQAKAESCRWYVWEKTNWVWSGNTLACSPADFVYKPWWHGLTDDGWLTLVSHLAVTLGTRGQEITVRGSETSHCFTGLSPEAEYGVTVFVQTPNLEGPGVPIKEQTSKLWVTGRVERHVHWYPSKPVLPRAAILERWFPEAEYVANSGPL